MLVSNSSICIFELKTYGRLGLCFVLTRVAHSFNSSTHNSSHSFFQWQTVILLGIIILAFPPLLPSLASPFRSMVASHPTTTFNSSGLEKRRKERISTQWMGRRRGLQFFFFTNSISTRVLARCYLLIKKKTSRHLRLFHNYHGRRLLQFVQALEIEKNQPHLRLQLRYDLCNS